MSNEKHLHLFGQTLAEAFPDVNPGARPYGERVLVQLRTPKTKSGLIDLPQETQDQDAWMTSIGKVLAVGPLAFKDRVTLKEWPEGIWAKVGEYVRCPKHGGDRWEFPVDPNNPRGPKARFVIYRDRELIGALTRDPRDFVDYV